MLIELINAFRCTKQASKVYKHYGELTRKSFENATTLEIERYLKENGLEEYIGYSRQYIIDRMIMKARMNHREYIIY